jgi:hypothetical protein
MMRGGRFSTRSASASFLALGLPAKSAGIRDDARLEMWGGGRKSTELDDFEPFLFGWLHDLDVMVIQQVSGCMVELRNGQLKIDLSLDKV